MQRKAGKHPAAALAIAVLAALVAVTAAYARTDAAGPEVKAAPERAAVACSSATIGVMGPFTGNAASIGQEQLKWSRYALDTFNRQNRTRFRLREADTQLVASQAATRATQLAADRNVVAVVGPA